MACGAVGQDQIDLQLAQGTLELRQRRLEVIRIPLLGPEDAVAVDVHRRHAPSLAKVAPQQVHVRFGRLGRVEPGHRLAGGVVDHHHQHHPRPAAFEPVVVAAVGLHQLAEALATLPTLAMLVTLSLTLPEALRHQPLPQRPHGHRQLAVGKLLAGEGGAKPQQLLPVGRDDLLTIARVNLAIRRPATQPVNHRRVAARLQPTLKPPNLTLRQPQQPPGLRLGPLLLQYQRHDLQPVPLTLTHLDPILVYPKLFDIGHFCLPKTGRYHLPMTAAYCCY